MNQNNFAFCICFKIHDLIDRVDDDEECDYIVT